MADHSTDDMTPQKKPTPNIIKEAMGEQPFFKEKYIDDFELTTIRFHSRIPPAPFPEDPRLLQEIKPDQLEVESILQEHPELRVNTATLDPRLSPEIEQIIAILNSFRGCPR